MHGADHDPTGASVFRVGSARRPSFLVDPVVYGDPDNARADIMAAQLVLRTLDLHFVREPAWPSAAGQAPRLPTWREWRRRLVELRTRYAFFVGGTNSHARHRRPDCVILGSWYDHPDDVRDAVRTTLRAARQLSDGCVVEMTLIGRSDRDAPMSL